MFMQIYIQIYHLAFWLQPNNKTTIKLLSFWLDTQQTSVLPCVFAFYNNAVIFSLLTGFKVVLSYMQLMPKSMQAFPETKCCNYSSWFHLFRLLQPEGRNESVKSDAAVLLLEWEPTDSWDLVVRDWESYSKYKSINTFNHFSIGWSDSNKFDKMCEFYLVCMHLQFYPTRHALSHQASHGEFLPGCISLLWAAHLERSLLLM